MQTPDVVFRGRRLTSDHALVMGIVNRTPDSLQGNGIAPAEDRAHAAIRQALEDGAAVIGLGGVPASPGTDVPVKVEIERMLPTVEWARENFPDLIISVATYRAEVADALCAAGADLINGNRSAYEPEILDIAARYGAGYVCSYTQGATPRADPIRPRYDDVVASVIAETTELAERAVAAGVPREGILIDPGIDFSENTDRSLAVLRNVGKLVATGWPVLMTLSGNGGAGETGTLATTALAAEQGATMFRTHHVRQTSQTVQMVASVTGTRPPKSAVRWL